MSGVSRSSRRSRSSTREGERERASRYGVLVQDALRRLGELPGGEQVLKLARARDDVELVGGAVRDLLLCTTPREIDLVIDGDESRFERAARLFADDLVELLMRDGLSRDPPEVTLHQRFRTATVRFDGGRVDIATRRAESYPRQGALPEVRGGDYEEDLLRRDFSVNAIAIGLGKRAGELRAVDGALEDLRAGRLRVLHDESFFDDPTRLLRLARYAARLGFSIEAKTAALAQAAGEQGALETISRARLGAELRLLAAESDRAAAFAELSRLGLIEALGLGFSFDARVLAGASSLLPSDGREDLLAIAALAVEYGPGAYLSRYGDDRAKLPSYAAAMREYKRESTRAYWKEALDALTYPARDREVIVEAAVEAPALAKAMAAPLTPSALYRLLSRRHAETVALAGAIGAEENAEAALAEARRWLAELRHVRLQITGADLVAAGCPQGREIGARLAATLRHRLDGDLGHGKEAELRFALGELDAEADDDA